MYEEYEKRKRELIRKNAPAVVKALECVPGWTIEDEGELIAGALLDRHVGLVPEQEEARDKFHEVGRKLKGDVGKAFEAMVHDAWYDRAERGKHENQKQTDILNG